MDEMLRGNPQISVNLSCEDLMTFAGYIMERTKRETEERIAKERDTLSATDASKTLGVTPSTLWRWEKSGYLTPVRIGVRKMYRRDDIDRVLNDQNH